MRGRVGIIIRILQVLGFMSVVLFSSPILAKSLLWKISDLDSTVYLFGSIHVGNETIYPLDESVKEAFALSRVLVLEINPKTVSSADILHFNQLGLLPTDKSLEDYLTPAEIDYVKLMAKGLGYNYEDLKHYKPWMAGLLLSNQVQELAGYKREYGIEAYLADKANSSGMPIAALESMALQSEMFAKLEVGEGKSLLISKQTDVHGLVMEIDRLVEVWKSGDEAQLDALINEDFNAPEALNLRKVILEERNALMADKIAAYVSQDKNIFVAAGAGHFVGKNSILEYLTQKGYKVERVKNPIHPK